MNLLPSKHAGKISGRGPISGPSFTLILSPSISVIALIPGITPPIVGP